MISSVKFYAIVGLILLAVFHVFSDNIVKAERDNAIKALAEYKTRQTALAEKQRFDNKLKLEQARAKISFAEIKAQNEIDKVLETSNETIATLNEKIRGRYEAKSAKSNMVDGVGIVLQQGISTNTITEVARDTEGLTKSESVTDTASAGLCAETKDLEQACAVTTIYFNQCREILDADSLVLERE